MSTEKSPDAFRTISEVSAWLDTPAHVLRFWESRFTQVKPVKRAGGRRYYRPADMALLGGIKKLLHDDGMTIRGVQKILRSEGVRYVASLSPALDDLSAPMVADAEPEQSAGEVIEFAPQPPRHAAPETAPEPAPEPEPEPEAPAADALQAGRAAPAATPGQQAAFEFEPPRPSVAPPRDEPREIPPRPAARTAPPELPPLDDPGFVAQPSPFPLADPAAARARLAADPARASALYARLVDLRGRMDLRPR